MRMEGIQGMLNQETAGWIVGMCALVLLIGLVAKNSILLVDLANQRRSGGMSVDDALADACPTRMRPVLMTSATVILALMPATLGFGAGAETNQPLAVAVAQGEQGCPMGLMVMRAAVTEQVAVAAAAGMEHLPELVAMVAVVRLVLY